MSPVRERLFLMILKVLMVHTLGCVWSRVKNDVPSQGIGS